tara:strand:+ start:471 stop:575 length:105 start_codon:yes stop_codon:yes gene_type:complete
MKQKNWVIIVGVLLIILVAYISWGRIKTLLDIMK